MLAGFFNISSCYRFTLMPWIICITSNSSFTSLIDHCCSLCSHYPYYHSSSIQEYLHPILFVDFTAFLICILSIFACFCMTRKIIVLILYSKIRFFSNDTISYSHLFVWLVEIISYLKTIDSPDKYLEALQQKQQVLIALELMNIPLHQ